MITPRNFTAYLLLLIASPALADIEFAIGEPTDGAVKSGIGQISGWAVSDGRILSIEAFIDGTSLGEVPYGGSRLDVAAAFPAYPDAEHSGWAMKWNYSLHEPGEHLLTIVVTEEGGGQTSRDVWFYTTRFNSEFIRNPGDVRTQGTMVTSPMDGRLVIESAEIEGELVDIELHWDTASQQFLIDSILYHGQVSEPSPKPGNTTGNTLESMLDDINAARAREQDCGGSTLPPQPPLEWSASLADIARQHSMDMAKNGYFSHASLDGTAMGDRVFPYWDGSIVGENIAASSAPRSDAHIIGLWLESAGHCELLMSPNWTHAGAGKAHDPDNSFSYQYFWTLDFGG